MKNSLFFCCLVFIFSPTISMESDAAYKATYFSDLAQKLDEQDGSTGFKTFTPENPADCEILSCLAEASIGYIFGATHWSIKTIISSPSTAYLALKVQTKKTKCSLETLKAAFQSIIEGDEDEQITALLAERFSK